MTLNMKNYKGFDKLPYCNAHVPKAKATVVADTPENLRLKANSEVNISSSFLIFVVHLNCFVSISVF